MVYECMELIEFIWVIVCSNPIKEGGFFKLKRDGNHLSSKLNSTSRIVGCRIMSYGN